MSIAALICHRASVLKGNIPEVLATSALGITCPFCGAKPGLDCMTTSGGFSAVHIVRIKAAAAIKRDK